MISVFPTEREAKRQVLLDAVDEVRDVLAAGADAAEQMATLPKATVEALYESGLLFLKLPAGLGGAEADLVTQLDVFEAVTRIDTSAGWCLLIGSASLGRLGLFCRTRSSTACLSMGARRRRVGHAGRDAQLGDVCHGDCSGRGHTRLSRRRRQRLVRVEHPAPVSAGYQRCGAASHGQ
jgi:hypothetical protein